MVKTKRRNIKGRNNFTRKLLTFFNPIESIIKTQIIFHNLDKIIKEDNRELNKKLKKIENDLDRIPCKKYKKKYRKECYERKRKFSYYFKNCKHYWCPGSCIKILGKKILHYKTKKKFKWKKVLLFLRY